MSTKTDGSSKKLNSGAVVAPEAFGLRSAPGLHVVQDVLRGPDDVPGADKEAALRLIDAEGQKQPQGRDLLSRGRDVSLSLLEDGMTLLHLRVSNDSTQVVRNLLSGAAPEWDGGLSTLNLRQKSLKMHLEGLDADSKEAVLAELQASSAWAEKPASHRKLVQLFLGDVSTWKDWMHDIRQQGLRYWAPSLFFTNTIKNMRESTRQALMQEVASLYAGSKKEIELHPFRDARHPSNRERGEVEMAVRRFHWNAPKRMFDLILHMVSGAPHELAQEFKQGEASPIAAYDRFLARTQAAFQGSRPAYGAEDVLIVARAMQAELRKMELEGIAAKDLEIVIYGSFPNGLAHLGEGFDFDLAVKSASLLEGKPGSLERGPTMFHSWSYQGSRRLERAGLAALSSHRPIHLYDPDQDEHRAVSIGLVGAKGLDRLSPVLLRITLDRIELTVNEPDLGTHFALNETLAEATVYDFRRPSEKALLEGADPRSETNLWAKSSVAP